MIDDIQYDTLTNGRLVANGLPGQLVKVAVDSAETYLRTNFDKSNNINYRDGDRASSRTFDDFDEEEPTNESETFDMYNSPVLKERWSFSL